MKKLFTITTALLLTLATFAQGWAPVIVKVYPKPTATWTDGGDFCLNGTQTTIVLTLTGKPNTSSPYWVATTAPTISGFILPDFTVSDAGPAGANWVLEIAGESTCVETWTYTCTVPNIVGTYSASGGIFEGIGSCASNTATGTASVQVRPSASLAITGTPVCDGTAIAVTFTAATGATLTDFSANVVAKNECTDPCTWQTVTISQPTAESAGVYTGGSISGLTPGTWTFHINTVTLGTCTSTNTNGTIANGDSCE